jgi:hypothetical protein
MPRADVLVNAARTRVYDHLLSVALAFKKVRSVEEATSKWTRLRGDLGRVADRLAVIRQAGAHLPEDITPLIEWIEQALDARLWSAPGGDVLRGQAREILDEIRGGS